MRNALFTPLLLGFCTLSALAAAEDRLERRFPASAGAQVVVDVDFGAIEVSTNAASEVVLEVVRRVQAKSEKAEKDFLAQRPVEISQEKDVLLIRSRKAGGKGIAWNWGSLRTEGVYRIQVPSDCRLKLQTAGGHIEVTGLRAEIDASTGGGNLRFRSIQGPLRAKTAGGTVSVAECVGALTVDTAGGGIVVEGGSGELEARTAGGSVRIREFSGPLTAATSGGSVSAVLVGRELPGPVRLATSGGSIAVSLSEGTAFNLDAATGAGSVRSEFPVETTGKRSRSSLKGPVNGGGPLVRLRTSGGSVSVRQAGRAAIR